MAHAALISPMWLNACGKFPDHLAAGRVDLLGQQADIADGGHGTLERRGGGLDLTGQRLRLRQPERAEQEGPLLTGEAVTGPVSVHPARACR
jgi:hypothetical protein